MKFLLVLVFFAVVVALVSAQDPLTSTAAATTAAPTTAAPTSAAVTTAAVTTQMPTEVVTNMTAEPTTMEVNVTTAVMTTKEVTTVMVPTTAMPPGDWIILDDNKTMCMNMSFKATFEIKYDMTDGKTNTSAKIPLPEMSDITTDGSNCSSTTAMFVLNFFTNWKMVMLFEINEDSDASDNEDYSLKNYTLTYSLNDAKYFPKAKDTTMMITANSSSNSIEADLGNYYKCTAKTNIKAGNSTTTFTDMKIQPFTQDVSNKDDYNECVADSEISNIVPIAVGCALAGLVLIVLVAYLIGRSRSNRQGYQSV